MELCDVFDEYGVYTGQVVPRDSALPPDTYFLAVHIWIRDEKGHYLIQQRASQRKRCPGMWATTVGYVHAGEDSLTGAIREVREELGIRLAPESLKRFNRLITDNRIEDLWLATVSSDQLSRPRPGPEVAEWKWASLDELNLMVRRGIFFGYNYLDDMPE